MAVATSKRYSVDDLAQFPDDGKLRELSGGRLVEWDVTNYRHGLFANLLAHLLTLFVRQHRLGSVTITDTLVRVLGSAHDTRGGDVAFFARGRQPHDQHASATDVVPDFVIEVLSPSDRASDVQAKVRDWLRAGVKLLWYVDPDTGVASVYRGNAGTIVDPDEVLSGEDILPGFTLRMRDLLNELAADEAAEGSDAGSGSGD